MSDRLVLYADRARLMQGLCNLITNAAKYSPPGGRIDIGARTMSEGLEISVRDRGVGIPHDKLTEIFNLFAQLDRGLERQGGGLGIGLTLARQIVELHQGTIEARSEGLGKGSEFVLHLPMLPARTPNPRSSCRRRIRGGSSCRPTPPPPAADAQSPERRGRRRAPLALATPQWSACRECRADP